MQRAIRSLPALFSAVLVCACGARLSPQEKDYRRTDVSDAEDTPHPSTPPDHAGVVGSCPVNIRMRIPEADCSDDREAPDGKWSDVDAAFWQSKDGPDGVVVVVNNGLIACPESGESGEVYDYRAEWNRQAQYCVRSLIEDIGGDMHGSVSPAVNVIFAELTWDQIQQVGELPDVVEVRRLSPLPDQ
jgi:hypothetical protein